HGLEMTRRGGPRRSRRNDEGAVTVSRSARLSAVAAEAALARPERDRAGEAGNRRRVAQKETGAEGMFPAGSGAVVQLVASVVDVAASTLRTAARDPVVLAWQQITAPV